MGVKSAGKLIILTAVILLLITSSLFAREADTSAVFGELIRKDRGDTTYFYYDIELKNFDPDTVSISFYIGRDKKVEYLDTAFPLLADSSKLTIYRRGDKFPYDYGTHKGHAKKDRHYFKGFFKTKKEPAFDSIYYDYTLMAINVSDSSKIQYVAGSSDLAPINIGFDGSFFLPGFGYYNSKYPEPFKKKSYLTSYDLSLNFNYRKTSYNFGTSWTGMSSKFTFSSPVRFRFTYVTGSRTNWMPQLYSSLKVDRFKFSDDDTEFFKSMIGLELGLSLEGRFERLSYHYTFTTEVDYHTVELFTPFVSSGESKLGHLIKLKYQDKLLTIQSSFYLQGIHINMMDHGGPMLLGRHDDRNIFRKALAYVGLIPYTPLYLIGKAIELTEKKDTDPKPPPTPKPTEY